MIKEEKKEELVELHIDIRLSKSLADPLAQILSIYSLKALAPVLSQAQKKESE